ncbi:divalent-cation tolerance protein CutA isoform X4 [Parasteatoda tepidariorum]|uniref:divalent-cation tolerance protein CutA isoform X4 n=1 Tax=Parasteatoda tepidariorum TaxID=114398 RepID=UPI001C71B166|nr:protein CutA homolog isoform X3 [Parasteatoda tepidariorum]
MKILFNFVLILMITFLGPLRRVLSTMAGSANKTFQGIFSVSYVTAPSDEVAKKIAEGLVKEKLAACVNIVPGVQSIYEWKGEIQKDSEVLMVIKSRISRLEELTKYVSLMPFYHLEKTTHMKCVKLYLLLFSTEIHHT